MIKSYRVSKDNFILGGLSKGMISLSYAEKQFNIQAPL
jgi:hypothetical protein